MEAAYGLAESWREQMLAWLDRWPLLACSTLSVPPPLLEDAATTVVNRHLSPVNLAGLPAVCVPVGDLRPIPASLQLIAGPGGEELLLAAAEHIEAARRH